jgi:hypothetical protein
VVVLGVRGHGVVALGHDVEIVVKPRKRGSAELRIA